MPTLHFSYSLPGGSLDIEEPLNSPYTIAYHVGRFLRDKACEHGYAFAYHNLDDTTPVEFDPSDIAIGHTWWDGGFMHQALNANIKGKLILQPYSRYMVSESDIGMVLDLFGKADDLLFITGEHWFQTMPTSPFAALYPKVTRIDMAVSGTIHPMLKTRWNKKGERAICVIGNDIPVKGFQNVAELARMAGIRLGHFGNAREGTFDHVPQITLHGGVLFTPDKIAALCEQYDALVCLATSDANPTVLLEAAAWGLRIYCNEEGGYYPNHPFKELRLNDPTFNVGQMRAFQEMDEYDLRRESAALRTTIERDYNFDVMTATIWNCVGKYL